ncbi:hypothetical protein GLYMA_16G079850v4 [Glycine max]|nr:hypothetical protein GLYMA_16G079850v4 [Glycine max]KAH1150473.1 hypothetical protein GYH30_044469 [Glycine max]
MEGCVLCWRDSWTKLFDVVIAKANKPRFYTLEHPFRNLKHEAWNREPSCTKCGCVPKICS